MTRFTAAIATAASAFVSVASANGEKIPGEYIVVFNRDTELGAMADHVPILQQAGAEIFETYDISEEFRGYAFKSNSTASDDVLRADTAALALAARDDVKFVEQDQVMRTSCGNQNSATWGIARLSNTRVGQSTYNYPDGAGEGITAYIIDTGVRADHSEFTGRVSKTEVFDAFNQNGADANGHGTHVAGTVAGTTYGVAKKATIATVRVLGNDGSGSNAGVISGIQYACQTGNNRPDIKKRVANMSLGGGYSAASNAAVKACVDKGMTFVVAAGNDYRDACSYSPASESSAITVMASDSSDTFSTFSNYGSCANIIAPGTGITSAWIGGSTSATLTISGTSMASPHVAGVAALIQANHPNYTPAQILNHMVDNAGSSIKSVPGSSTPNRLLFSDCNSD